MNFFCIAFFITAIQINISQAVNYIVKLVGLLFFMGGILEISGFNKSFKKLFTFDKNFNSVIRLGFGTVFDILVYKRFIRSKKCFRNCSRNSNNDFSTWFSEIFA